MAKPVDWIGQFIELELAAFIAWWKNNGTSRISTNNSQSRFENDGSSFRVSVNTSSLPLQSLVQISEVVSSGIPPVILITDGHTQITAKLSDRATQALESEIGEKINAETTGDVIYIHKIAITSSPYSPWNEQIQLEIMEIEYMYHLRKSLGRKGTILERPEAVRLLDEIAKIRSRQHEVRKDQAEPASTKANVVAAAARETHRSQASETYSPQSQQAMPHSHGSQHTISQPSYATQLPFSRKRKAPTMAEDGDGLAKPHGPGFISPTTGMLPAKRPQLQNDKTGVALLSLLGNRTKEAPLHPSPAIIEQPPGQSEPRSLPSNAVVVANENDISGGVEQMSIAGAEQPASTTIDQPITVDRKHSHSIHSKYSRRRIPLDQKNVLEKPDSWLPAMPGKHLPQPNVPIRLLKQWHAQTELENETVAHIEPTTAAEPTIVETAMETTTVDMAMETSDPSSESSEDELLEGEWPPSPSQRQPQLPPDSTVGNDNDSSPLAERTRLQPSSPQPTSLAKEERPPDSSAGSSNHSSPLTKQTQRSPGGSHTSQPALSEREQPPPDSSVCNSDRSSPVTTQTQRPLASSHASQTNNQQISGRSTIQNDGRQSHENEQHLPSSRSGDSKRSSPAEKLTQHSAVGSRSSPIERFRVPQASNRPSNSHISSLSAGGNHHSLSPSQSISSKTKQPQGRSPIASIERTSYPQMKAQRTPDKPKPISRPSTSNSVVKGTQLRDKNDMDMEMSVPRSLEHKPEQHPSSIAHRKERSSHLKTMQRVHWLQTTYDYNPTAESLPFSNILTLYKASHANDIKIRPSEFAEAVEAAFPQLYPNDSDEAVGGLKPKGSKAPNVGAPPIDGDVLMTNTDVPTAGTATDLRRVSAEPARGSIVDGSCDGSREQSQRSTVTYKRKQVMAGESEQAEERRRQARKDESDQMEERHGLSRWAEFERAMKSLGPGGAFAGGSGNRGGRSRGNGDRGRLNVLEWDL